MTRLATVFAALLLISAGNLRNINAAVTDDKNRDIIDVKIVLDQQDCDGNADGVVFTRDNLDLNFDVDGFLNVDSNRGQDATDNRTDDASLQDRYADANGQLDNDGGDVLDSNNLPSDTRV